MGGGKESYELTRIVTKMSYCISQSDACLALSKVTDNHNRDYFILKERKEKHGKHSSGGAQEGGDNQFSYSLF